MFEQFKREPRYLVFKLKDLNACKLPMQIRKGLDRLISRVNLHREENGKPEIECVVVENDWPEYETVWKMLRDRVEGRPNEIESLRAQLEAANANYRTQVIECQRLTKILEEEEPDITSLRAQLEAANAKVAELTARLEGGGE